MKANKMWALGAMISALALAPGQPARAGDMSNAVLTCYVDTFALDVPEAFTCFSTWKPGRALNPTGAYFQVAGLGAGNYSYAWLDVETNLVPAGCGDQSTCRKSISTETRNDGEATLRVTITDLDTGATRNAQATAFYNDGYN